MFKIKVLRRIKKVFSDNIHNPIFAGFGNKSTDAVAYSTIGVDIDRIFTIQSDGQIYLAASSHTISYRHLLENIDVFFPEVDQMNETVGQYQEHFYWRKNYF